MPATPMLEMASAVPELLVRVTVLGALATASGWFPKAMLEEDTLAVWASPPTASSRVNTTVYARCLILISLLPAKSVSGSPESHPPSGDPQS